MSYYVESDGDRVPKDVYICANGFPGRVLTMDNDSENARFKMARFICDKLNQEIEQDATHDTP